MRYATKTVARWFGVAAGLAGIEHGYFEILQGNTRPESLMIVSMGPPCVPEEIWNACEPAMTILPNFLLTGILAVLTGLFIVIWSLALIPRKHGGLVLILSSVLLLLLGGGLFPPLIGIVGGVAGLKINKPLGGVRSNRTLGIAARLWPWPLVIFLTWVFGQWIVGTLFNEFLQKYMGYAVLLILVMLPLSVYSAYAYDVDNAFGGE